MPPACLWEVFMDSYSQATPHEGEPQPWSRSRFWLCHFLHSRHVRPRVKWDASLSEGDRLPADVLTGLRERLLEPLEAFAQLLEHAPDACGHDPALVQTLRLHYRERAWQEKQLCTLIHRHQPGHVLQAVTSRRKRTTATLFGMRYFLASLLLDDLLDIILLGHAMAQVGDKVTRQVLGHLREERVAHAAFLGEYLTLAYADFNFIRRNLRRARLRGLFAIHLRRMMQYEQPLLQATGLSRRELSRQSWRVFGRVMERVVPYRRDALLAALTHQRDRPFEDIPLPSLG